MKKSIEPESFNCPEILIVALIQVFDGIKAVSVLIYEDVPRIGLI
jgi:hypothetical protein